MAFWDILKKAGADAASTVLSSVTGLIDEVVTNKQERAELKMAAEKQIQDYSIRMTELTQEAERMYIEDIQNARALQIEALKQNDLFSKRFVYYLSIGLISATIIFDFLLFFIHFPEGNRDMINMALGTFNSMGFASVVTFFLGSSKSSSDKNNTIANLVNTK